MVGNDMAKRKLKLTMIADVASAWTRECPRESMLIMSGGSMFAVGGEMAS